MKTSIAEFGRAAKLIRSTGVYDVYDLPYLSRLVVSMTILHPGKETSGHSHEDAEEVYLFLEGAGEMQLDEEMIAVSKGDIVLIPKEQFHKVFNRSNGDLVLLSVFEKYGDRGAV